MKYFYLYILISILFIGCKNQTEDTSIFIGGEIINPKSNVVVLMQKEKVIDSIPLKEDNTFSTRLSEIKSGLYYFRHGYEYQYLFLEPQDSIHLRLNTWDFDETLVFEGIGAAKNELLLNLFLENEKEEAIFYSYFVLNENDFQNKINDANSRHTEFLTALIESDNTLSKQYIHLAEAAIKYPLLRMKEIYPYYHKKALGLDSIPEISNDFYNYRKEINLNDSFLSEYYAYQNFVTAHLYNLAYNKNKGKIFDKNFRTVLLQLIVEKIDVSDFRSRLLNKEINNLFFNNYSYLDKKNLELFYTNCTDTTVINNLKQLIIAKEKLPLQSYFPDFEVNSILNETRSIQSIIKNKNVVIYFWSSKMDSNEYLRKRVNYLCDKFPQITFVGINVDDTNNHNKDFFKNTDNQYYLTENSKGNELTSNKYPRAILINSNGKVINSFALLTNIRIEKQLHTLLDN